MSRSKSTSWARPTPASPSRSRSPRSCSPSCCSWCSRLSAPLDDRCGRSPVSLMRRGARGSDVAATTQATRAGVEVRLEDLRRSYVGVSALNGLTLTLPPGELVALLGAFGCGKTTAMRLVGGLEEADGGRVVIAGQDVTNRPANKRDVGMVFQAYSLFPHMTAWQNVAFGLQMRKVDTARRRKRAGDMLDLVGLSG